MTERGDNSKTSDLSRPEATDAYLPLEYYVDFLKFLNDRRDQIEIITYRDLPWGTDYDFERAYPDEWRCWEEQLTSGERSRHKIYLLLQHDVDNYPERTTRMLEAERSLGIRSNVMIFNTLINRPKLETSGDLEHLEYPLDDDVLRGLQGDGFVIGYHCNAYEQALFDLTDAGRIFANDVDELRARFDIEFFSAHGGVRDTSGQSNACIRVPESLRGSIRWVHNTYGPRFHATYSDGAFASGKKPPEALDLRAFAKSWRPGRRYRILVHPQYYHERPSRLRHMETTPWYREVWARYGGLSEGRATSDPHSDSPLVSLLINNHNYAPFLGEAIESALGQSYARTEVIVVDDGSTDGSRDVIREFGDRITPVFRENGGQASAFNAGVSASRGDILCFLDADDLCLPERAERVVELFSRKPPERPAMVCHRLESFGERVATGSITPSHYLDLRLRKLKGDVVRMSDADATYQYARRFAYLPFLASPTSGISIDRRLADLAFPLPETHLVGADCVMVRAAMLLGDLYGSQDVLGRRRIHGDNHSRFSQKHLVDERFLTSMNDYLNGVLEATGREPVIKVFDSMGATRYYTHIGSVRDLLRLTRLVPSQELSWQTLSYSIQALWCAATTAVTHRRRDR